MIIMVTAILAVGTQGAVAHSGKVIPLCTRQSASGTLVAHLVSAFIGEQMGRDVKVIVVAGTRGCYAEMEEGNAPISVIASEGYEKSDSVKKIGLDLETPIGSYCILMGSKAVRQLAFSLVPMYLERLSKTVGSLPLAEALERVRAGRGPRRVALKVLREADLI